jgi:hypothetical protein
VGNKDANFTPFEHWRPFEVQSKRGCNVIVAESRRAN